MQNHTIFSCQRFFKQSESGFRKIAFWPTSANIELFSKKKNIWPIFRYKNFQNLILFSFVVFHKKSFIFWTTKLLLFHQKNFEILRPQDLQKFEDIGGQLGNPISPLPQKWNYCFRQYRRQTYNVFFFSKYQFLYFGKNMKFWQILLIRSRDKI